MIPVGTERIGSTDIPPPTEWDDTWLANDPNIVRDLLSDLIDEPSHWLELESGVRFTSVEAAVLAAETHDVPPDVSREKLGFTSTETIHSVAEDAARLLYSERD